MKVIKRFYVHVLSLAVVMVALAMTSGTAVAGFFDFTQGRIAQPGTELHELGTEALRSGLGGISYFTNGEGRVVEIRAKKMADIQQTGAKTVLTQCPACRSYLRTQLDDGRVTHPIVLLARAYGL